MKQHLRTSKILIDTLRTGREADLKSLEEKEKEKSKIRSELWESQKFSQNCRQEFEKEYIQKMSELQQKYSEKSAELQKEQKDLNLQRYYFKEEKKDEIRKIRKPYQLTRKILIIVSILFVLFASLYISQISHQVSSTMTWYEAYNVTHADKIIIPSKIKLIWQAIMYRLY